MAGAREDHLLVDLVAEQDEPVPTGDVGHPADGLGTVDGAGRVVGVDHHQRGRPRRDLGLDVRQRGVPAVGLVRQVVHGHASGEVHRAGPGGVVRCRDQDLVARIDHRLQDQSDELAHPVAQEHVLGADPGHPPAPVVLGHRRPCLRDAPRIRVGLARAEFAGHGIHDLGPGLETERVHVPQVQSQDVVALGFQPHRLGEDRTADVVAHVAEASGLAVDLHVDHHIAKVDWRKGPLHTET